MEKSNQLQVFSSEEFGQVRTVTVNGEPWLVGKGVAEALGYTNPQKAIRDHVDEEDKRTERIVHPSGGAQDTVLINESGLYSLVLSSKLPNAKKFRRWITSEVLPSIRKTGSYAMPQKQAETDRAKILRAEAMLNNSLAKKARELRELIGNTTVQKHKDVLVVYSANMLAQKDILELPAVQKSFTATQVGEILNISANKVGRIAKRLELKADGGSENEYGYYVADIAKHNNKKQVESWRYYQKGIDAIRKYLEEQPTQQELIS